MPSPDRSARLQRLIHRSYGLAPALQLGAAATYFLPMTDLVAILLTPITLAAALMILLSLRHGMTLCEHCVTEFRVDAAEYAAARARRFRVAHTWPLPFATLLLLVGGWVVVALFEDVYRGPVFLPAYLLAAFVSWGGRFHSVYQPWCPYCRGGGGGGHAAPAPEPTGGNSRPLPA
ncbi:hypothetical protein ACWDTQ_31050 [Streptomyces cellulosae]